MSENLPERVSAFREALESAGTLKLGSMGAPNRQDDDTPTIPTAFGRELAARRYVLEEEQKETVSLIASTNKRVAEIYINGNTEFREATAQVMEENDKITSQRQKAVCDDFEAFTTKNLGVDVFENMRWAKGQVQGCATRFVVPETPRPKNEETAPKEMVLKKRGSGGLIRSLMGRGEEIWEVNR